MKPIALAPRLGTAGTTLFLLTLSSVMAASAPHVGGSLGGGGGVRDSTHPDAGPPPEPAWVQPLRQNGSAAGGGSSGGLGSGSGAYDSFTFFKTKIPHLMALLRDPAVQADLGLRPDQRAVVVEASRRIDTSDARLGAKLRKLDSHPDRQIPRLEALKGDREAANREDVAASQQALSALSAAQRARLEQIRFQVPELIPAADEEVVAALGLTAAQIQQARQLHWEALKEQNANQLGALVVTDYRENVQRSADGHSQRRESSGTLRSNPDPAVRAAADRRSDQIRQELPRRIFREVLTPAQQAKITEMRGRPLVRPGAKPGPR